MPPVSPYRKEREKMVRVVTEMPPEEVAAIDEWGVAHDMPSRTAAIRQLLKDALKPSSKRAPKP